MARELVHAGQLAGHRAAVVGAGSSGLAAAKLLCALGAVVRLLEKNPAQITEAAREAASVSGFAIKTGEHAPEDFAGLDMVVLSPGVRKARLDHLLAKSPKARVMSELELASWFTPEPMAAVTGSNGKTTTVMLVSHVLEAAGLRVFTGGNIGTPLSEHVLSGQAADVVVLEVSSFQLQNVATFKPKVGVLLNFSANHLDWHADMEEYLAAKLNLFATQGPTDVAVLPQDMRGLLEARDFTKAEKRYFAPRGRFSCERLVGEHNQANMEAAWQACRVFGVDEEAAAKAMADFVPPAHRLQAVGEKRGVLFVDDSKATTVEALRAALLSFDKPVRLLAGGVFKGGDLAALLPVMRDKVRAVGLFGASREIFEAAWAGALPVFWEPSLRQAMNRLYRDAEAGEVLLLSPATASFDLYADYKARGRDFRAVFADLPDTRPALEPAAGEGE